MVANYRFSEKLGGILSNALKLTTYKNVNPMRLFSPFSKILIRVES